MRKNSYIVISGLFLSLSVPGLATAAPASNGQSLKVGEDKAPVVKARKVASEPGAISGDAGEEEARQFAQVDIEKMMNGEVYRLARHPSEDYFHTIHLASRYEILKVEKMDEHYLIRVNVFVVGIIEQDIETRTVKRRRHKITVPLTFVLNRLSNGKLQWNDIQLFSPYIRPGQEGDEIIAHPKT